MRRGKIVAIVAVVVALAVIAGGLLLLPSEKGDVAAMLGLGNRFLDELDWESAAAQFEAVLKIDPRNVDAIRGLAEAYCKLGRFDDAVELLESETRFITDARLDELLARIKAGADLETLLKESLGVDELTDEVLASVTQLELRGLAIRDISLLERCVNLQVLYITSNYIRDLTPLTKLEQLWLLDISDNPLADITQLGQLSRLECLSVDVRQSEIEFLSTLDRLFDLHIFGLITDVTPLARLEQLIALGVSRTRVIGYADHTTDVSIINDLPPLDISPLSELKSLTILELDNVGISDLSPISQLTELEYFCACTNNITDLTPLAELPRLDGVTLFENPITDWSPLSHIENVDGRPE